MNRLIRCDWVNDDILYQEYHDNEWGIPEYDSLTLFENLCLEGQQAGLSWITVLKKRETYRRAFFNFDPELIAKMDDKAIEYLMNDSGVIRHRLKLNAIVKNAQAYLLMKQQNEDFPKFIWSFVGGSQKQNNYRDLKSVPTSTVESEALSKALKKKGFTFVGPTICYAFMQAMGLVNDHLEYCFCHNKGH